MYKWIDAEGNTHYTQSPPPDGIGGESIKPPPNVDVKKAQQELKEMKDKVHKNNEERAKQSEEINKQKEQDELKKENCRKARERLSRIQNTGMVRAVDEEGNVERITTEMHQQRLEETQAKVDKWCN